MFHSKGREPYWLTITGTSGSGKTHLAKKICHWFRRNLQHEPYVPRTGEVWHMDYAFKIWSKALVAIYEGEGGLVEMLSDEWLAVIDDVGAEHDPRKFGVSKLLEVLENRKRKWTVITSNLTLDQISSHLDTRIASRMIRDGSKVVNFTRKDFNL